MLPIPPDALSPDVLTALIEEFVTRQGTDLTDADAKVAQVRRQLRTGEVVISWDEKSQSANIVAKGAREEPPLPRQEGAPRPSPSRGVVPDEDGRRIEYDEPAPRDVTDY